MPATPQYRKMGTPGSDSTQQMSAVTGQQMPPQVNVLQTQPVVVHRRLEAQAAPALQAQPPVALHPFAVCVLHTLHAAPPRPQ